ncbi:hypothetical protein [Photobacterium lipolyticum]|uniref:hypothetical protein n=1 Tax=Photobacterium lipolyticum TaxID=266810 RepID=UPI0014734405|nr:hypothetical protein [Photobacterium lipolyticum]
MMPASSIQEKCAKEWLVLSSAFDTEVGWLDHSRRASFPGTNIALLIFDVEQLYLQIIA